MLPFRPEADEKAFYQPLPYTCLAKLSRGHFALRLSDTCEAFMVLLQCAKSSETSVTVSIASVVTVSASPAALCLSSVNS